MRSEDYQDFVIMLEALSEYYGKKLSPAVVSIYWQGLQDLDFGAVRAALNAHVQNPDSGQYMPKIADIRKMVSGTTEDSALKAWTKVDRAVRHVGIYADVVFDDPLIHRVLADMGGWVMLGSKRDDEWPFVEKEFVTRYRGYKISGEQPEYPTVLVGLINSDNRMRGYATDPPRFIGDPALCQIVFAGGVSGERIGSTTVSKVVTKLQVAAPAARIEQLTLLEAA